MIDFEKIASLPEFQSAPREKQLVVRDLYFKNYMADQVPPENGQRAYRDFVYAGEPVLSATPPDAEKSLLRRGLEWGAGALGVPMEPSRSMRSEEGARALIDLQAKDAGMKPGEYRVGPQALNQAAGAFVDAAMVGIPGAIRKEMVGGEGLVPKATTPSEKIASGVGELAGFIAGAPGAAMKPITGLVSPAVKYAIPRATTLLERAATGVATQAPALATAFATRNIGEALQQPTIGKAAGSIGRAAGEGLATGGIFGGAGAINNRIARISVGLASMEAERSTGLKAPVFDDRPLEEKAFDIAQTLFFLWNKGGNKVLDQAEASMGRRPATGEPLQLPPPADVPMAPYPKTRIYLHEPIDISVRDVPPEPPGPPPALVGRRQAVLPPTPVLPALPPPGREYRGPFLGEGFEMMPAEPSAPIVEQKRRPAAESANVFQEALNTARSPQGMALLKSRLAAEQAANPTVAEEAPPSPTPTMAQLSERVLGNAPILSPLEQAIAPKPAPLAPLAPKKSATPTFQMDPDNEAHFQAWLDQTVPIDNQAAVEKSMRQVLSENPSLVEEGRSWPEIRRMAEGGVAPETSPAVKEPSVASVQQQIDATPDLAGKVRVDALGAEGSTLKPGLAQITVVGDHPANGGSFSVEPTPEKIKERLDQEAAKWAKPEAPAPLVPPAQKSVSAKAVVPFRPKAKPGTNATTLRGAIKAMGGVNPLNFKGEFKEAPTASKYLIKRSGTPIDLAEQRLKEDGWLLPDESLAMVLRDTENLRRGKVAGEGVAKREQDLTAQEREVKAGMEWEPEEPPLGDYVPMKAEDLPVGKKLTLIAGKSARGWDTFEVKNKDELGVTLKDGETIELPPGESVEVRREDLPGKEESKPDTRPALVLQGERQMPKVQAEMRTRGKKMGKAQQGGIEFGAPPSPETLELKPEPVSAKEKAGAEIVKKRMEEEGWKTKTTSDGKTIEALPGKGTVSGDESMGWFAFDQKGRVIGEGDIVDGFKKIEDAKKAVVENAKPKVDAKDDIGSMADRMKDADPELSSAKKVARVLLNENGAIQIDVPAIKRFIKNLKSNMKHRQIGFTTQSIGLPWWVAKRYPESAGKIQAIIDNKFHNNNMIRNQYHKELIDSWKDLTKDEVKKLFDPDTGIFWKEDSFGGKKKLKQSVIDAMSPAMRKAYDTKHELDNYHWFEDRVDLMRRTGVSENEIKKYYADAGYIEGWMPHERKGRYFARITDKVPLVPGEDKVYHREHFNDMMLTATRGVFGKKGQVGIKQALVGGRLEDAFPDKLIELGENFKAAAEGAYSETSPKAIQELIEASMKYMDATDEQKAELKQAAYRALADVYKVRGFGEHFKKRHDIPGFDKSNGQDALLNYYSAWAGYKSKAIAAKEIIDAWWNVDWKNKPELRKYVAAQVKDVMANETFADRAVDGARAVVFRVYLSGVFKSAWVQGTQNFTAGIPYLMTQTNWSAAKLAPEMVLAAKDLAAAPFTKGEDGMGRRQTAQAHRIEPDIVRGLNLARQNGNISAQLTAEIMGRRVGKFGTKLRAVDNLMSGLFQAMEIFNRETLYIAAHRIATKEKGMDRDKANKFAEDAVEYVHGRYGKTNLPPFARGEHNAEKAGRAAYSLGHYTNHMAHFWTWLAGQGPTGAAAAMTSIGALLFFGGATAFPLYESLSWVYTKATGRDLSSDIAEKAGKLSDWALYGFHGGALGVDISGSLGMSLPSSLTDLGGPLAQIPQSAMQMHESFKAKDYQRAMEDIPLFPSALKNMSVADRLLDRGMEKRSGTDIKDEDFETVKLTPLEAFIKGVLGFQPVKISEANRKEKAANSIKQFWADKADSIRRQSRTAFDKGTGSTEWSDAVDAVRKFDQDRPNYIAPIDLKTTLMQKPGKRDILLKREIK